MTETANISRPPFDMVGIDHVVFYVDDMPKAMKFYSDVLGCVLGYSYPKIGMEQVWCGAALIVLYDITNPGAAKNAPAIKGGRNVDHVCIALGPFDDDALKAHLRAHNVTLESEAFHGGARGLGKSFVIVDPFGNKLELKGPPVYPDGREAS